MIYLMYKSAKIGVVLTFTYLQIYTLLNPILPGLLNTLQTWGGAYFTPLLIRLFFILEA